MFAFIRYIVCMLCIVVVSHAWAAPAETHAASEKNAQSASTQQSALRTPLDLASILEQTPTAGSFTQTRTLTQLNRDIVLTGTFTIGSEKGLMWNVNTPIAYTLAYDGEHITKTYQHKAQALNKKDNAPLYGFMYLL